MIKSNKFFINKLDTVIFIGENRNLEKLININKKNGLKTFVITSSHQSKLINKKIKFKIFDKIDANFSKYIKKICNPSKTLFISIGSRIIFKNIHIKNIFSNNLVNYHNSRLPYDSGGGDFTWRILREDRIDTQTIHLLSEKIDEGPIIIRESKLFPSYCKLPIDFDKESSNNLIFFYEKFLNSILKTKKFNLFFQIKNIGRYNPRVSTKINGFIDWSMSAHEIFNFINAFGDPFEGASTFLDRGKYGILRLKNVHLHGGDSSNHPFMSGIVNRHDNKWLVVSTNSKYMLLVEEVLDAKGKNIISKIKRGDRFFVPLKYLILAKKKRIFFSNKGLQK